MPLRTYGREVSCVFDLRGRREVDLTAALGWVLEQSPTFTAAVWSRLGLDGDPESVEVSLEVADAEGRTDLELRTAAAAVVVEAKKGWILPGETQLGKYVNRLQASGPASSNVLDARIVTLSDSSVEWAAREVPAQVEGIRVTHLPWDAVRADLRAARRQTRGIERLWLEQFITYLAGATAVSDPAGQWVYIVSVSTDTPNEGGPHTFRDYVTQERAYFHPFGKTWPKYPPTLIGFRWDGHLQQVNRVVGNAIVPSLHTRWPAVPEVEYDIPFAVYDLGPDIPIPRLPSGGLLRARRLWALLDQLLTQPSIVDAEKASKALTAADTT